MRRSANHIRDGLADAIRAAAQDGCRTCTDLACPTHAAEAVLDLARSEKLLILDSKAASETIDAAGLLYADNRGPAGKDWPPRAGDVWRDGTMGDTWFARLNADNGIEFVDYAGFVLRAGDVASIEGGMHLISRAATITGPTVNLPAGLLGDFTAHPTRITINANRPGSTPFDRLLTLHIQPTNTTAAPDDLAWFVTSSGGEEMLHHPDTSWIGEWSFRNNDSLRPGCLTDLATAVRRASDNLRILVDSIRAR